MHGRADRHFAGLQIQMSQPLAVPEQAADEAFYFLLRFLAKCLRSLFFNCSSWFASSSTGAGRS